MMRELQLVWELNGHGWATCHLDDGVSKYRTVPSYLTERWGISLLAQVASTHPAPFRGSPSNWNRRSCGGCYDGKEQSPR